MKTHTIRCVFAPEMQQMHLNICVFKRKGISMDATYEKISFMRAKGANFAGEILRLELD